MSTINQELSSMSSVSETRMRTNDKNKINNTPNILNKDNNYKLISNLDNENENESDKETLDNLEDDKNNENLKKSKRVFKSLIKDIIVLIFTILSAILYVLSLEGCHDTQTACLVNLSPEFFHRITIYLMTSSFINSFIIYLIINKKINSFHIIYMITIFLYLTLIYDVGGDLAYHGSYNRSILIILTILFQGFILIISSLFNLIRKRYFKIIITGFLTIFSIIFYFSYKLSTSCQNWNRGLNDAIVENDLSLNKCQIPQPKTCWVDFMDGLLDVSWLLNENCDKFRQGERTELMKYLKEELKETYKLGYPITTKFNWMNESKFSDFLPHVLNNMTDLDNTNSSEHEVTLQFDRETKFGTINIEIKRNETLVNQRQEIIKNEKNLPKTKNILFIYVDSISRPHFMRKMKKTSEWIEKYIKRNNDSESSHIAYQFMKYQAFIFFTQLNIHPMFYGQSMYNKNGTNIIKHFKEKGFITGQSNNICSRELYDIEDGYIDNMEWEDFDHENIALFCDPNFFNPENPYTPYMGPYSVKKRCLYGRNTFEYVLEYGEKFWETYINERKFLRVAFQDAHEGTGEVARYLDEHLYEFLIKFEAKGWLNDTSVFFVSDHGNNMIGFYNIFNCEDFVMEKTLATLFLLMPRDKVDSDVHSRIKTNEQVMVTPYDIYNTLLDLGNFNKTDVTFSHLGDSLVDSLSGLDRDCLKYKQDLSDLWCRCY